MSVSIIEWILLYMSSVVVVLFIL